MWALGTYYWANERKYQGEWYNGLKHGKGIFIGLKGYSYNGNYRDG